MKRYLPITIILPALLAACTGSDKSDSDAILTDSLTEQSAPAAVSLKISPRVGNLARQFNDLNAAHLDVAQKVGISPIKSVKDVWHLQNPLEYVTTCEDFTVDSLTHSFPYLVPGASTLLHDIGRAFRDSLKSQGGGDYRIVVTSVLRTAESVGRLRRRNVNSTQNSAHLYGTTFDISYIRFQPSDSVGVTRREGDLKNMLAEVLMNLREQGRCLVKYERKQGCFHITSTE